MRLTAILPFELNGVAVGGNRVRKHTFWKEMDFVIPQVAEDAAPIVISWDTAFDDGQSIADQEQWGAFPESGVEEIRYHSGSYWRQCLEFDAVGGPLASRVLDVDGFEATLNRPERHDILIHGGLPVIKRGKETVRDASEIMIVQNDLALVNARSLENQLQRLGERLLIVDNTIYLRCREPLISLERHPEGRERGKHPKLLKIVTDDRQISARRYDDLVPIPDFDTALDESACNGRFTSLALELNERRRPTILRPDLLRDLDTPSFRALSALRQFRQTCYDLDMMAFAGPHQSASANMAAALENFFASPFVSDMREIEECLDECLAAFAQEPNLYLLEEARDHLDGRAVRIEQVIGKPMP